MNEATSAVAQSIQEFSERMRKINSYSVSAIALAMKDSLEQLDQINSLTSQSMRESMDRITRILYSDLIPPVDLTGFQAAIPTLASSMADIVSALENLYEIPKTDTDSKLAREQEIDISQNNTQHVQPVEKQLREIPKLEEIETVKSVLESTSKQGSSFTKEDVLSFISILLALFSLFASVISLITPVQLDEKTSDNIASIESNTETIAENTDQIIDLSQEQIDILKSIDESLKRLVDCIDISEEADDQEPENTDLDGLEDGQN